MSLLIRNTFNGDSYFHVAHSFISSNSTIGVLHRGARIFKTWGWRSRKFRENLRLSLGLSEFKRKYLNSKCKKIWIVGTDTIWLNLIAGGIAGAGSLTATAPLDRLKVILQVQTKPAAAVHAFSKIWRDDGLLGFFRGNGLRSATVVPKVFLIVCAYGMLKQLIRDIKPEKGDLGNSGRVVVGGLAGAVAHTVFYPLDLIKTRLQTWPSQSGTCPKLGTLTKNIWNQEGPRAFYRGLAPSLLPIFPVVGIYLATNRTLEDMSQRYILYDGEAGSAAQRACQNLSGALVSTCVYPLQVICTRLQARPSNDSNSYKGMSDVVAITLKREGLRGFYKGFLSYLLVLWPAASITFVVYGAMKNSLGLSSKGCLLCRASETDS